MEPTVFATQVGPLSAGEWVALAGPVLTAVAVVFVAGRRFQRHEHAHEELSSTLDEHFEQEIAEHRRNCARFGLVFDELGVDHSKVLEAEARAGVVDPKP